MPGGLVGCGRRLLLPLLLQQRQHANGTFGPPLPLPQSGLPAKAQAKQLFPSVQLKLKQVLFVLR